MVKEHGIISINAAPGAVVQCCGSKAHFQKELTKTATQKNDLKYAQLNTHWLL